jgi:hypothetical protein
VKKFLNDIYDGYYAFQLWHIGPTLTPTYTQDRFPFIFLGYYAGFMTLLIRIFFRILAIYHLTHLTYIYFITTFGFLIPYLFAYRLIRKVIGKRDLLHQNEIEGRKQKLWKFLLFALFSLLSIIFFPLLYDLWLLW